jgi:hypothetical protein
MGFSMQNQTTHPFFTRFISSRPHSLPLQLSTTYRSGSVFELLGGDPQLGSAVSAAIAVVGFPATLFLFFAAIKKVILGAAIQAVVSPQ